MAVIMLAWPSSCWHGQTAAYTAVGMLAVIILAWLSSCWHVGVIRQLRILQLPVCSSSSHISVDHHVQP